MNWVTSISAFVWVALSHVIGVASEYVGLKSATVLVVHSTFAYISSHLLSDLSSELWALARNDIASSLQRLLRQGYPGNDLTMWKIYKLLVWRYLFAEICDCVNLFNECPKSSKTVEEGHGSTGIIDKYHTASSTSTTLWILGSSFARDRSSIRARAWLRGPLKRSAWQSSIGVSLLWIGSNLRNS